MEVKISLSDGFETFEKSAVSDSHFISMYMTENELESYSIFKNASEWIRALSRTTDINMSRLSYIVAHALMCAYRQDFHSMIIGSLKGTVKNAMIEISSNEKTIMNAFVDVLYKVAFIPEANMNNYIFFSNEKLISEGGISSGYMCMDFFVNTADVSYKINSIQQSQEDSGVDIFINETDVAKIGVKLSKLKNFMLALKDRLNGVDLNARVKRLKDILGFGVAQGISDGTEILLVLKNNSGSVFGSETTDIKEIDLSNIILLDEQQFRKTYDNYIDNNVLDYESACDDYSEDSESDVGLEIVKLSDMDLVLFELLVICVDICFVKDCNKFIVIDLDRYFVNAVDDIDKELALILPLFNNFIKSITGFNTIIYIGVKEGSATEAALKLCNK